MIYLWEFPEYFLNKHIAVYHHKYSVAWLSFRKGKKIDQKEITEEPIFDLEVTRAEIQRFDNLPSNAGSVPLVNQKIIDLLLELAPEDVQFFDAEVRCKDGVLTNYKMLNVTHTIRGIDHEKSVYTKMKQADAILGFNYLTYQPGCMGSYQLARDEEYKGNLLVTETIKQAFNKNKITGVRFVRPEDFYRPLRPEDFYDQ